MYDAIFQAIPVVFSIKSLLLMFLGTGLGIAVGAMPGLTASMGVALLIPLTFGMPPAYGLVLLGSIYCGAIYGGSISAILLNVPGTPSSAATLLDGFPMTQRGEADKALKISTTASFTGGIISAFVLLSGPASGAYSSHVWGERIFLACPPGAFCHRLSIQRQHC